MSSFISPKANRRTDDYGGSINNHTALTEIMRAAVGHDFPL